MKFVLLLSLVVLVESLHEENQLPSSPQVLSRVKRRGGHSGGGGGGGGGYVFIPDSSSGGGGKEIDSKGILFGVKSLVLKAILLTSLLNNNNGGVGGGGLFGGGSFPGGPNGQFLPNGPGITG